MATIDVKEVSDGFKQSYRNKNCSAKNEQFYKSDENGGVMSLARWFRELRGRSYTKDDSSKPVSKTKDERRVKLNRTNSALPSNFKSSDFGDSENGRGAKYEKKIKELDKRRYSFNGGSSTKLSRSARTFLLDDRRLQKRQAAAVGDERQTYHFRGAAGTPSCSQYREEQQQLAMIGSEVAKKTHSSLDHKHTASSHLTSSSPKKPFNSYKKNFDEVGLPPVKNYDVRSCDPVPSQSSVPPVPPLRDASSLLVCRYITAVGHEKYPSWPSSDPSPCSASSKLKSLSAEEQFQNSNYGRDRSSNKPRISQLKTVVEKCEKTNMLDMLEPTNALDEEARSRERIYMPHMECERIFADDDDDAPCPPDRDISLAKLPHHLTGTFHQYSHSHQDSSYMSQDGDYAECYADESRTLLTKAELEQYTKHYEDNIVKGSHQKQPSYAQSEGYHSYVSSNDSAIITPLIDRLRRENDAIVSTEESVIADRESSASSGSSSDTLKWHGSLSDVSVVSGSYRGSSADGNGGNSNSNSSVSNSSQPNIVHSARVQTPQRHHSESVLYLGATGVQQQLNQDQWTEKVQKNNQLNSQMRKLFPVHTYSVYPQTVNPGSAISSMDSSPTSPKLTVAERIIELERQQLTQATHQQFSTKYTYLDPDKKHRVSDQNLKVIQKKALLSYYERHHSSWRSEPQLSPTPPPPLPPPPSRPRLPTPTSLRSPTASDNQESMNKENTSNQTTENCNNINDVTSGTNSEFSYSNEIRTDSQYSSSCGSLPTANAGAVNEPVVNDDWVPELPPKKAHLRSALFTSRRLPSPDLPPPSPPPIVDDEVFISDEPLPPPPPEIAFSGSSTKNKELSRSNSSKSIHWNSGSSHNIAPDLILSSTVATPVAAKVDNSCGKSKMHGRIGSIKFMKSGTNQSRSGCKKSTKTKETEFLRYSQHLYKEDVSTAEYRSQNELELVVPQQQMNSVGIEEKNQIQNSDFLIKRSVFSNECTEQPPLQHLINPPYVAAGHNTTGVVNRVIGYEQQQQQSSKTIFENKSLKADSSKNSQFSSAVQRHSEKFPPKLDPHCPPPSTNCKSQSSYRREPRDREKGLPNFEGSYKRTMSPSPSCANLTNGYINGTNHCVKDVENVDPKIRTRCDNVTVNNGKYEKHPYTKGTLSATSPTSQPSYRNCDRPIDDSSLRKSLTTRSSPTSAMISSPSTDLTPNTLPKNSEPNLNTGVAVMVAIPEPKQRNARAPRTQSDPSSVKDSSTVSLSLSTTASSTLLSSQSSSSSLYLQKTGGNDSPFSSADIPRSQSDLSNVGSTESGYSSLSLNVPSPSVSPTRLSSSGVSSTLAERTERNVSVATSWSCTGVQCDIVTSQEDRTIYSNDQSTITAKEDEDSVKYPQKSEIVLRISATTSDAASQTDSSFVTVATRVETVSDDADDGDHRHRSSSSSLCSRDRSTSPIFKQKSQEEIDCEELSRDLVNHLSSNDHLYRLLTPRPSVKKSIDYLENVFRPNVITPFSEYNCSSVVKQSEDTRLQEGSILNDKFSYHSEAKQNEVCDNPRNIKPITIHQFQQKKEKLIDCLDQRLNLLKAEQAAIVEECRINDALGDVISQKVTKCVNAHEAAKYKLHIQEIGHITSLLLGLSGRLAKVENSLLELTDVTQNEKSNLESKRDKLLCQLEEAKALKANIDKRSGAVSAFLVKYFTDEEIAEYEYFVHMKSKLLIDCRDIAEKIQNSEQQLNALKEIVDEEKY